MWLQCGTLLLAAWLGRPQAQPLPRDYGAFPAGDHYREYYQRRADVASGEYYSDEGSWAPMLPPGPPPPTAAPAPPRLRRYGAPPARLDPEGALKEILAGRLGVGDAKSEATLLGLHETVSKVGPRRAYFLNRFSKVDEDPAWATVKTIPVNTRASAPRVENATGPTKRHPSFIFTKSPTPKRTPMASAGALGATRTPDPFARRGSDIGRTLSSAEWGELDHLMEEPRHAIAASEAATIDATLLFTDVEITTTWEKQETHDVDFSQWNLYDLDEQNASMDRMLLREQNSTTLDNLTSTATTMTTQTQRTTKLNLDLNALISIVAELAYNIDYDLVADEFNKTMIKYSVPTCSQPTTTTTTTPTPPLLVFDANATIMAKCFVCGMEATEIPYQAHCADAFAGDFIPVIPVDATSKHYIASFRKYCRYMDISNFVESPRLKRDVYGRWTGGCSVRWTDLSGVYTQRACRSKRRAATGRHFASKRMAKLEMALHDVDNGCIVSPAASLLPLSRGISLYARVHACVCTGSFCNGEPRGAAPPGRAAFAAAAVAVLGSHIQI